MVVLCFLCYFVYHKISSTPPSCIQAHSYYVSLSHHNNTWVGGDDYNVLGFSIEMTLVQLVKHLGTKSSCGYVCDERRAPKHLAKILAGNCGPGYIRPLGMVQQVMK